MNEPNTLSPAAIPVEQRLETLVTLLEQVDLRPDQAELIAKINSLVETLQQGMSGRSQPEAALRDSEARYRRILETALEGIGIGDVEGRTTYINPRGAAILGYNTPAEMIGRSAAEFMLPEDLADSRERYARLRQGESLTYETRMRTRDGSIRWLRLATSPIVSEHGIFQGFLTMFADIHERRLAAERAARLQAVTAALSGALTPAQVAEIIFGQALPALHAAAGSIYLLGPDGDELVLTAATGYPAGRLEGWQRLPLAAASPVSEAARTGRLILLESREAVLALYPHLSLSPQHHAWAVIPLPLKGRTTGALGLSFAQARQFSPDDQEFMLTLAGQCAQAIERARLYEAERQARTEASTARESLAQLAETEQQARQAAEQAAERAARLQTITAALADTFTPVQVSKVIMSQALPLLNGLGSTVYLLSDDNQELQLVETMGYPPEVIDPWQRFPADSPIALADAVRSGRPVLLKSREAAAAAYPHLEFDRPEGGNAWAALPLLVHGRATGVMGLTFAEPQEFSPEEQDFLLTLAGQCAQALERAHLYAGLAEAHALLDTIFDSAPIGLGFWNRELRFTRLNPALAEMNGLPVEAHLGKTPAEILPDVAGLDQIVAMWRQVLETGQPIMDVEVNGQTPARPGEQRAWLESWYPVKVGREIIGVGGVVQEVTERKRMEAQLRAALAEKEALVKEVYHRVKNNLQGVYYLVSLQAGHLPDGPARQALLDTQARIRSMTLIHDKLSRSHDVTRLDFADYIRSLAGQLIGSLHSAAGSIQLEVDFDDLAIDPGTATTLGIVVNELLTNALKHAFPPGLGRPGQIRIELRAVDAQWMHLVIGDNGIGLPADFDLAATGSLGLQLVTGLIDNLKGQVELHGQGGTTFKIMLPRTP